MIGCDHEPGSGIKAHPAKSCINDRSRPGMATSSPSRGNPAAIKVGSKVGPNATNWVVTAAPVCRVAPKPGPDRLWSSLASPRSDSDTPRGVRRRSSGARPARTSGPQW
jgi:hypothetical protein